MGKNNSNLEKVVVVAGTCATIGGSAAAAIAGAVSAPVTLPVVLVGGMIGCATGAILSSRNKDK